jgi:uncharacterized membrane protein
MLPQLKSLWISIRSSLWFVPTGMVVTAILLAVLLVEVDRSYALEWLQEYPLLFGAGAEGSRGMLTTIAGSMITVAGITFSLTIAALATASSQYTSRILRNFMRDRHNQVVMGAFVAIFAYCLVVLRTIRSADEGNFVPSLAVFAGLILALLGIGVLVFFIHHVASSIQASSIISAITAETMAAIDRMFPEEAGDSAKPETIDQANAYLQGTGWHAIDSVRRGYVQHVDAEAILKIAERHRVIVRLELRPGDFVMHGTPMLSISGESELDDEAQEAWRDTIGVNAFRTIDQEFGFGIRQLVDIALKALSPGVNDTTTAVMCIQHLGAISASLASRSMPDRYRARDGKVRLLAAGVSFADALDTAYDQIRNNAAGNVAVIAQLIESLAAAAHRTTDRDRLRSLQDHLDLVTDLGERTVDTVHDRARINVQVDRATLVMRGRGI